MSRKNRNIPKLDLKLNLSPPGLNPQDQSSGLSPKVSPTSTPSSSVSSEPKQEEILRFSNSPDAIPMTLVGCRRCLIYIFLPKKNLRCPQCQSTDLIKDFKSSSSTSSTSTSTTTSTTTTANKHPGN